MSQVARFSLVAAVLSGAVLLLLPAISFAADTHRVAVVDNAYDDGNRDGNAEEDDERRSDTLVTAGDTVVWKWEGDNRHTVTSRADSAMQFDSDADCGEDKAPCRAKGNRFEVTFDEPGTYDYYCRVHSSGNGFFPTDMTGTIEVQPAPEPSESGSGSSEPSSEQSSEPPSSEQETSEPEPSESSSPSSSPQEEPNPEPTSETASEPQDDPDGSAGDGGRPPRRADAPGFGVQDEPTDSGTRGPGPRVAPETDEGPTFSPFPSAPDLPSESETEDMAVNVPTRGGGPSRGAVVGVAIASVIGSAGVFGKVVLFGQPWG